MENEEEGIAKKKASGTDLVGDDVRKLWITVAQRRHGNSSRKVEVLAILNIPEPRALPLNKHRRRPGVGRDHVRSVFVDEVRAGGVG